MLDDRALQRAIARHEIASIVSTTRSVLRTVEAPKIQTYRTTITYFRDDNVIYSDAIAVRAPASAKLGYSAFSVDDVLGDGA